MKPWREVAVPHYDVLEGTLQQAEFVADITAARNVKAEGEGVRQLAYRLYTLCER